MADFLLRFILITLLGFLLGCVLAPYFRKRYLKEHDLGLVSTYPLAFWCLASGLFFAFCYILIPVTMILTLIEDAQKV
jgi:hypothetical protein